MNGRLFRSSQPLDRMSHDLSIGLERRARLVPARALFTSIHRRTSSQARDYAVARGISEPARAVTAVAPRTRIARNHSDYAAGGVRLDSIHVFVQLEAGRLVGIGKGIGFAVVLVELFCKRQIISTHRQYFIKYVAESRIRPCMHVSAGRYADLRRVASAEHASVLKEKRLQTIARSG